jgi:hypothetical protein
MDDNISFDDFAAMLDEIAAAMPRELFEGLNGGVSLLPDALPHPEFGASGLYILGQYHRGGLLGRYITIHYGSFMRLYGRHTPRFLRRELDRTLRHELLHHLESLAGERELELKDEYELGKYRRARRAHRGVPQ